MPKYFCNFLVIIDNELSWSRVRVRSLVFINKADGQQFRRNASKSASLDDAFRSCKEISGILY